MRSPVYWHPLIYKLAMRLLYGKNYGIRYEELAKEIGGLRVLDLCCGDCELANYIDKNHYSGIDINPGFVKSARKRGLNVEQGDIRRIEFPKTDCIVIQSSLYQFYPEHEKIIKRMLESADKKAIVSENVVNLSNSRNRLVAFFAKRLANPGTGHARERLSREDLEALFRKYGAKRTKLLGRDLMGVFEK